MTQPASGPSSAIPTGQALLAWRLRTLAASDVLSRLALLVLKDDDRPLAVDGFVRGPLCEYAATLPARHAWKPLPDSAAPGMDRRIARFALEIPESCLWEPEHPFLYEGHWTAADRASVPVRLGVRVLALGGGALLLNGRRYHLRGVALPASGLVDPDLLRRFHRLGVNLLLANDGHPSLPSVADELGPFLGVELPPSEEAALAAVAQAGPLHPSIGLWLADLPIDRAHLARLRAADKMALFAGRVRAGDPIPRELGSSGLDLVLLSGAEEAIRRAAGNLPLPWLALLEPAPEFRFTDEAWSREAARLDGLVGDMAGALGWIARLTGGIE